MVYDEKLAERIRKSLKGKKGITERKMFGGMAFLLNGKMLCGVINNDLMVRLGTEYYEKALTKQHVRPMDFTGRPMKGFVYVESNGCKTDKTLLRWIDSGIDYVTSIAKRSN